MDECDITELELETLREIRKWLGAGTFEYYHIRQKIPGYGRGIHRRLCGDGYLEMSHVSGKAKVWKVSDKTLKLLGAP